VRVVAATVESAAVAARLVAAFELVCCSVKGLIAPWDPIEPCGASGVSGGSDCWVRGALCPLVAGCLSSWQQKSHFRTRREKLIRLASSFVRFRQLFRFSDLAPQSQTPARGRRVVRLRRLTYEIVSTFRVWFCGAIEKLVTAFFGLVVDEKSRKTVAMTTKIAFSDSLRVVDVPSISNCRIRTTLRKVSYWRALLAAPRPARARRVVRSLIGFQFRDRCSDD